jgi:hypothetical protein
MTTAKTLQDIDKIKIIDTIIEFYPELKKDRNHLINVILDKIERPDKYILDRIQVNKEVYYKDIDNIIIDGDLNICGICVDLGNSTFKYIITKKSNRLQNRKDFTASLDKYYV